MSGWPRVAFIAGTLGPGGAERQLHEHCRILVDAGAPPVVLSLTRGEEWEPRLRDLGVEVVWVGRAPGRLRRLAAIVSCLRGRPVDVIQASHSMANLYAAGAGRILRRPSVGALRTTPERVVADLGRLGRPALRAPHRLVGNSRANLDAAISLGVRADRIRYVPNAVDLTRFAPRAAMAPGGATDRGPGHGHTAPDGAAGPDIDVLFIGRLGPEKRVDTLIEAVGLLRAAGRSVSAAVVGAGPLDGALRTLARDREVGELVDFVGGDPAPERWLARARLLALPSEREGMPNVVLEAMASGLPVVATPVGSVPDLVEDGRTGWLVPVGDAAALAAALQRVLADPAGARAMGIAGRRRVEEGFDRAAVKAALAELYRDLGRGRWPCAA